MGCNCASGVGSTIIQGLGSVGVQGSGTPTDPYIITDVNDSSRVAIEVRDTATVNMTAFGSGSRTDPFVIYADTSSAASLRALGDVAATPVVAQGTTPIWIGSAATGHFEFRLPGTRYTTNATRGTGLYQGEVIRETDTGKRYEWDGTQYVSLDVAAPAAADFSQATINRGTLPVTTDWNTLVVNPGMYRVGGWNTGTNAPTGAYNYGTLVVDVSGLSVTQTYYSHSISYIYTRTKWDSPDVSWTAWRRQYSANEGLALEGRATSLEGRAGSLEAATNSLGSRTSSLESRTGSVENRTSNLENLRQNGGWQFTNGAAHASAFQTRLSKNGNIVSMVIHIKCNQGFGINGIGTLIVNIDPNFRPQSNVDFIARTSSDNSTWATITAAGQLDWRGGSGTVQSGAEMYANVTWPLS